MKTLAYLRLTRDVINPRADRRNIHDWRRQPVITTGFRLRLVEVDYTVDVGVPVVRRELWTIDGGAQAVGEAGWPDLFAALLDASEPRAVSLMERLDDYGVTAEEVLAQIGVTDEQLQATADALASESLRPAPAEADHA